MGAYMAQILMCAADADILVHLTMIGYQAWKRCDVSILVICGLILPILPICTTHLPRKILNK